MYSRINARIVLLFCCFLLVFLILGGKIAYLQLYQGEKLTNLAVENRMVSLELGNVFRGDILDREGRSLLDSQGIYHLAVFPSLLCNPSAAVEQLSTMLPEYSQQVEILLSDKINSRKPFLLKGTLTEEEALKLSQQKIPGIYAVPLISRYGHNTLARHIVGCTTGSVTQGMVEKGIKGIEAFYNKELTPPEPVINLGVVVDGRGELLKGRGLLLRGEKGTVTKGKDVVLTLDRDVQQAVEKVLDEHIEKGAVALIDIPSGEIRALASRPSYSYNEGFLQGEEFDRSLKLIHPGSIFKIVVAAAALTEGVVHPDEKFNCNGKYVFENREEISCWKKEGHGEQTFREAFANSCNQVFVEVALRLGSQKLEHYSQLLGLEEGITGYTPVKGGLVQIGGFSGQVGNAALGQDGVTISPLNLAVLAATVARGGVYQKPSIVQKNSTPRRVLPSHVAKELQEMMELAVADGTGRKAQIPGLGSAGKTGSAETGREDAQEKPVIDSWFVGYTPLEKPQMAIAVYIEGGGSGGDCAAVIFREIVELLTGIDAE
ncbi:peptidoglycan D,D-transpeptidase FtsI family protein [Syntrophaceticus schinkii]|jgi:penicillin-binding protein 2|uniref:Putative Peptidoglycan glycosyltransferase n=1 Tax=Syntrophaceticus schinkii TaxID=499207 RepID=A0A0B7MJ18_9FIRM|nr:penicillin-binding protein 2 [Syntrophaceticus schinkii]CEO90045.1 putative Peptidoglycan glycosyltransferase [Syntrophaceticus schinkii]